MKRTLIVLACGLLFHFPTNIFAQTQKIDKSAGEAAFQTCRGCHSSPQYSNVYPTYYVPKIGGQRPEYIVAALTAYKEKNRPHGTMKANSYDLSVQTIQNIAVYVAASNGDKNQAPADGNSANGKKLAAACVSCHTNNLKDGGNIPILAGQYGNYLVKAMKNYQSGKRNNPVMQSMLNGLSDDDLNDISAYFAYMKGLSTVK